MSEYLALPFVEIEIRLGTMSKTFDSNVDKKYFRQIMDRLLENKNSFVLVQNKSSTEFVNKNLKLINGNSLIMKENVFNKISSLSFSPFDIKLSVNQEFKLNSYINSFQKNEAIVRKKERTSFINPDFRYDLTIVHESVNNVTREKYEIEIEITVNKNTLTWSRDYMNEFIECKIYDLVKIIETIDRDQFRLELF